MREQIAHGGRDDAALTGFGLIGDQDQIIVGRGAFEARDQLALNGFRQRIGIDEIDSGQIFFIGAGVDELGVGEGGHAGGIHQQIVRNAARGESCAEFVAEAIVADHAEHGDLACAERGEIVGDGAGGSGSDFGGDDADARDAGFARGVGQGRIVAAPAVEADIAGHEHAELAESGEDFGSGHSNRQRAGSVARCSPRK